MKSKITISLDDSTYALALRCGNVSQYTNDLLAHQWTRWMRAYLDAQQAGLSRQDIAEACRELNGCWLVGGHRSGKRDHKQECLEILAWEWWHNNAELLGLLGIKPGPKTATGRKAKSEQKPVEDQGKK